MTFDSILANFAKHITLNEAETAYVCSLLRHRTIRKNDFLLRAGDICGAMSFVSQGILRVFYLDEKGKEHILHFAPEGWWATDVLSFSAQTPAFYAIDALEGAQVWQLSRDAAEKLYVEVPKFERFFRILTQNAYALYQQRIVSHLSLTGDERYRQFLKKYPKLAGRIAQKHIASYLGVTPEFLSVMRRRK